jgi:hypothetical protein
MEATGQVYFPGTWLSPARARSWHRRRRGNYCPAAGPYLAPDQARAEFGGGDRGSLLTNRLAAVRTRS